MTVEEFINGLSPEYLVSTTGKEAHAEYREIEGSANIIQMYFVSDYNKHCVKLGIEPLLIPVVDPHDVAALAVNHYQKSETIGKVTIDVEGNQADALPKRVITNYKDPQTSITKPGLIPTGTIFDRLISKRVTSDDEKAAYKEKYGLEMPADKIEIGGFTRQCVDITAGKAGSGKTYSRAILAAKAKIFNKREFDNDIRVGFISGEMRKSEWDSEVDECELFRELEVDYMLNYVGYSNYEEIFWEAVADYDIVIIDSLPAIISHFRMVPGEKRTEKVMIFDFIRIILQSVEKNNNNVQLINQAVKDGNYKGGTELPHMMSSMSFVHIDDQRRYMTFDKNRNNGGTCKQKLYFSKLPDGDIEFNEEVYLASYYQVEDKKASVEDLMASLEDATSKASLDAVGEEQNDTEMTANEMEEKDQEEFEASGAIEVTDEENTVDPIAEEVNNFAEIVGPQAPERAPGFMGRGHAQSRGIDDNQTGWEEAVAKEEAGETVGGIPKSVIAAPFRNRNEVSAGPRPGIETTTPVERPSRTPRAGEQIDLIDSIKEVEAEQENAQ